MIYLIIGRSFSDDFKKINFLKDETFSKTHFDEENFDFSLFNEVLKTKSLFGEKRLIIAKRLLSKPFIARYIVNCLDQIDSSPNVFLFWEEEVKKEYLTLFKKKSAVIEDFSEGKKEDYSFRNSEVFEISDSFFSQNPMKTWLIYQKFLLNGGSAEDVFWKLFWQLKAIIIAKESDKELSGLHPFVYKKSRKMGLRFNIQELVKLSQELVTLYYLSRRGEIDLAIGLERLIFSLDKFH